MPLPGMKENGKKNVTKLTKHKNIFQCKSVARKPRKLIDCTDKYVADNNSKKIIMDKKKTAVIAVKTPETIESITSTQKDENSLNPYRDYHCYSKKDGSFEINEKITKELDVTSSNDLIPRLKPLRTDPLWKTALTLGYLNMPHPPRYIFFSFQLNAAWEDLKRINRLFNNNNNRTKKCHTNNNNKPTNIIIINQLRQNYDQNNHSYPINNNNKMTIPSISLALSSNLLYR
ncbi:hypothetical protein Glove_79g35 [Diversispora epigaea]|uniref:Uncharacterized protein n=1 Tax=Diversispora epigaea TaxID=1348612 RepID=A0A397JF59_9GLOM|nr:hypothetical protein Glove_79g35 [Diversispora epigaea]